MRRNPKLLRTIGAILSAAAIRMVLAVDAPATAPPPPAMGQIWASAQALHAVVVTAARRCENLQDAPVTVQVLNGRRLRPLHRWSIDDYVRMNSNLTSADTGPR